MKLRFTENARLVVFYALEECDRLRRPAVEPEHILLGMLTRPSTLTSLLTAPDTVEDLARTPSPAVENLLQRMGVAPSTLLATLNASLSVGDYQRDMNTDLELTARGRRVLDAAIAAAREFQHQAVGTPHLLLGVVEDREGLAGQTLIQMGITPEALREAVRTLQPTDSEGAPE